MAKVKKSTYVKTKVKQKSQPLTRGKYVKWTEDSMMAAVDSCINESKMSVRAAAKQFGVPRATLQSRINGKVEMGAKAGRKSLMPIELETKLLDYADNRARMGIGFGNKNLGIRW